MTCGYRPFFVAAVVLFIAALAAAFVPTDTCHSATTTLSTTALHEQPSNDDKDNDQSSSSSSSSSWIDDAWRQAGSFWNGLLSSQSDNGNTMNSPFASQEQVGQALGSPAQNSQTDNEKERRKRQRAVVVRAAARAFRGQASQPSNRDYTTRKDSLPSVAITGEGVVGDYNHYRTKALQGTPDRAVSILTMDAMKYVDSLYPGKSQHGDLGENLLLDGMEYHTIRVGDRFRIGGSIDGKDITSGGVDDNNDGVLVVVTEPIEPCANLCTLPYINDPKLPPYERIGMCTDFIKKLDAVDGLRGWYAKVLQPGTVRIGDEVVPALL